ncbi:MAG: ATP-binding protein [Myxococcota bacterium]
MVRTRSRWSLRNLRIRTRLLAVNLVVLLVPVAGLEFARIYERQLLGALERDMANQATLVRELVAADGAVTAAREAWLTAAARNTRTRIRILDAQGALVADSHRDGPPEGPESAPPKVIDIDVASRRATWKGPRERRWSRVADRAEVQSALAGRRDAFTRVRDEDPQVLLFLAEPLRVGGQVVGVAYLTRSTRPVLVQLYRIRSGLIRVLLLALAFTVIVTGALAFSISRPLSRLHRAARRVTVGDRGAKIPVGGAREIRELGEAFATMTEQLRRRLDATSALAADVAHEFKSPLTSLRGAAELLEEEAGDDPKTRARFLANIRLDVDRLDRMVSRLLELSRLDATIEPLVPTDLGPLLARVVARTHTEEQPVRVVGPTQVVVRGRPVDLERALLNLVENALRFGPAGAPVRIELTAENDVLHIDVVDAGPGVSAANRDRIFERFFTTDRERRGTGLGLAIVASVAERHGGRIELRDGVPTTFRLTLPAV